eukprot:m.51892 g.51892  ORF g.51892 m.51892 type:complete len:480 (-) comp10761_c0_seq3:117-1556(-)
MAGHTTRERYLVAKRFIDFTFLFFGFLAVFDFAADTYMFTVIQGALEKYEEKVSVLEAGIPPPCPCSVAETEMNSCEDPLQMNASVFCETLESYNTMASDQTCRIYAFTESGDRRNENGTTVATFSMKKSDYLERIKRMRDVRTSHLSFLIVSFLLLVYYLHHIIRKRKERLKLLPVPLEVSTISSENDDDPDECPDYAKPPSEPYPGKLPAPHFFVAIPTKMIEQAPTPAAGPIYQCGRCGSVLDDSQVCHRCEQELANDRETFIGRRLQNYLYTFILTSQARLFMLFLADMPQFIIVMFYIINVDNDKGLACQDCAMDGDVCKFGEQYNVAAVILTGIGVIGSMFLLLAQVVYMEQITRAQSRNQHELDQIRMCGVESMVAVSAIPLMLCPILVIILVTDLRHIWVLSDQAVLALIIVAAICGIPWLLLFVGLSSAMLEFCDFACPGLSDLLCPCCDGADADCCDCAECCEMCLVCC